MRKIILFIASSIDGYIARQDGGVDWLDAIPNPDQLDYGYQAFYQGIDTTLMGYRTYQQIKQLSEEFPYPDKVNYVFSRSAHEDNTYVKFVSQEIISFVKGLKSSPGSDIWLVGGGQINTLLMNADLIDEMIITSIPIVLGEGIALFMGKTEERIYHLLETKEFGTGIVQLRYIPALAK